MKKNITLWQMIVGMVICAIAVISIFIPGIGLNASKTADVIAGWSMEQADKMAHGLLDGLASEEMMQEQEDMMADSLKKSMEEAMGTDEVHFSVFQLFFKSVDDIADTVTQAARDNKDTGNNEDTEDNKDAEDSKDAEDNTDIGESQDIEDSTRNDADETDKDNPAFLKSVAKYYNFFRIAFGIMIVLLIAVLVFVLLAWFGKVSRWLPVIFAWVYAVINIVLWIACYAVLPSKMGKIIADGTEGILAGADWLMGGDSLGLGQLTGGLDINATSLIRSLLWKMNYPGMYIWDAMVILLLIWTVLCLCIKVKKTVPDVSLSMPDISFAPYPATAQEEMPPYQEVPSYQEMPPYQEVPYASQESTPLYAKVGVIHGINGSLAGAEIILNPGEQIIIGRDPSVCGLILTNPKVSRKHCTVSFNAKTGLYDVFCFSRNGMSLSDGREIAPMQPASIRPGIRIILANGNEVIALD